MLHFVRKIDLLYLLYLIYFYDLSIFNRFRYSAGFADQAHAYCKTVSSGEVLFSCEFGARKRAGANPKGAVVCHRFEMVSGEEADAVLDWLRAVRRALASGTGAAMAVPPAFGKPVDVPFDALDCYPGAESLVIVMDGERIEGDWVSDGEGASFVGDRGGDLARVDLLWGVDVSWKRGLVFNARIESALSGSGLWSEAVENGRCIVPVRAFYETRNVDGGTGGRKPQYRFASAGGTALLLAGLRLGDRFVLVTCEPDAVVGRVHSRMPLSLTAPEALAWLDRSTTARDLLARHAPVPLEAQEEPAPTRRPADSDQMSLF